MEEGRKAVSLMPLFSPLPSTISYCSKRRLVGGAGAGSPQILQKRALARFICPHGHGRRVPETTVCTDVDDG